MSGGQKRRALGKGLSSLIPDKASTDLIGDKPAPPQPESVAKPAPQAGSTHEVPIGKLQPNPYQPRREFAEQEIESLARSIRASGIIQPLLVREEKNGGYTLIAGERRLRAAGRVGLKTVPVVLRDVPDERLLELALVENIQRDDLGPMETARAFRALVRKFNLTQAEVASRVGKTRSTVANFLRLLELAPDVRALLDDGSLSMGHGRALAGLTDPREQSLLAQKAVAQDWSVRKMEEQVRRVLEAKGVASSAEGRPRRDPNVSAAEQTLSRAVGSPVTIRQSKSGKGSIQINFGDAEDLERIFQMLIRAGG